MRRDVEGAAASMHTLFEASARLRPERARATQRGARLGIRYLFAATNSCARSARHTGRSVRCWVLGSSGRPGGRRWAQYRRWLVGALCAGRHGATAALTIQRHAGLAGQAGRARARLGIPGTLARARDLAFRLRAAPCASAVPPCRAQFLLVTARNDRTRQAAQFEQLTIPRGRQARWFGRRPE